MIQGAVMETRSRAIARRQDQYVVFFINGTSCSLPTGSVNSQSMSIASYDNTGKLEGQLIEFPEHVKSIIPTDDGSSGTTTNFYCTCRADGTVALSITDKDSEATGSHWDLVFQQQTLPVTCRIDIVPMTGQVIFKLQE